MTGGYARLYKIPRTGIFKEMEATATTSNKKEHNRDVRELWRKRRNKEKRQRVGRQRTRKRKPQIKEASVRDGTNQTKNGSIAKKES